jgi:hypothetical protein
MTKKHLIVKFRHLIELMTIIPKCILTLDYDNTRINWIQKNNIIDWLLE